MVMSLGIAEFFLSPLIIGYILSIYTGIRIYMKGEKYSNKTDRLISLKS
jgi:hypothetical protein